MIRYDKLDTEVLITTCYADISITKIAPNNPKGSMLQQASLHVMRQLGKPQSIIPR